MTFQLQAVSTSGTTLVHTAERLAASFAERADEHDRDGSYPFEAIDALRQERYSRLLSRRSSVGSASRRCTTLIVASSRLARGNASVAIGVNMHLTVLLNIVRRYTMAVAAGSDRRASAFASSLESFARQDVVLATAISERNQIDTSRHARHVDARWLADRGHQGVLHHVARRDPPDDIRHLRRRGRR